MIVENLSRCSHCLPINISYPRRHDDRDSVRGCDESCGSAGSNPSKSKSRMKVRSILLLLVQEKTQLRTNQFYGEETYHTVLGLAVIVI